MNFEFGGFGFSGVDISWYEMLITILIVLAAIIAIIWIVSFISKKLGYEFRMDTRDLTYAAACLAIGYALSFIRLRMPQGGSITPFSTLPIMLFCYYGGFRKASVVATAYMLLQLLQSPSVVSPWSLLFDYIFPYLFLALIGITKYKQSRYDAVVRKNKLVLRAHIPFFIGATVTIVLRYASYVLSGLLFYEGAGITAWAGWSASLIYNSFVLIDFAIAMVGAVPLLCSKTVNTLMAPKRNALQYADAAQKNN